jgi:molybdopterin-guanine dinucleotide biosynthesis protein A
VRAGAIDGLLLAGGHSRRFGSDKRQAQLGGRTLLAIAAGKLARVASGELMVAVGVSAPPAVPAGAIVLRDEAVEHGPLGGIVAGLRRARTGLLVLACDLPWVDTATLELLARLGGQRHRIVAPRSAIGWEPLVAYYPRNVLDALAGALRSHCLAPHRILEKVGALAIAGVPAAELRNVNRPTDLPPSRRTTRKSPAGTSSRSTARRRPPGSRRPRRARSDED